MEKNGYNAKAGPSNQHQRKRTSSNPSVTATPPPASPNSPQPPTHVQAIHDFHPNSLPSTASAHAGMYLSFKAGEVIRVHVRDSTGWWDGEIAAGGVEGRSGPRRGWFPSNYVREMGVGGSSHQRAESQKSESTHSPTSHLTDMSGDGSHSRHTSANSHVSHTSQVSQVSQASQASQASQVSQVSQASKASHISQQSQSSRPSQSSHGHQSSQSSHTSNVSQPTRPSHISHMSHLSQASEQSQASRASSSQSTNYAPSPTHRSMAILPSELQILLHPILQALTLIDTAIHSNRRSHVQPGAACVISAVRGVLSKTDCLQKESTTLRDFPQLLKERKVILSQLSALVAAAKAVGSGSNIGDDDDAPLQEAKEVEDLAKAGRSVFAGMKRFLQYCNDYKIQPRQSEEADAENELALRNARAFPESSILNPQIDASDIVEMRKPRTRLASAASGNARIQETFKMRAASIGDLRAARRRVSSPPPPMPTTTSITSSRGGPRSSRTRSPSDATTPISATFTSSSSGRSSPVSFRSVNDHRFLGSMDSTSSAASPVIDTHPQVWGEPSTPAPVTPSERALSNSVDVLEAISLAEDALLSIIAAFIGHIHSHHIGSHPSSHANLIEMTRETIDSVRDLLTVVEAVGRDTGVRLHRSRDVENLRVSKDTLYEIASRLVEGVELIGNAPFTDTAEEDYEVVKQQLLSTATATLRAGTECVRWVRLCVPEGSDSFANTPTPRHSDSLARQVTPRPLHHDAAVVMREKIVGQRGTHTLSSLHRKASSLSLLQRRFKSGESLDTMEESEADTLDDDQDDEEEIVADSSREEDMTLRLTVPGTRPFPHRPPLIHTHTSPALGLTAPRSAGILRTMSEDAVPISRSRSSSLTSPAPPSRMTHRSPSRSADLDKFTSDLDLLSISRTSSSSQPSPYIGPLQQSGIITTGNYRSSGASDQTTPAPTTPHVLGQDQESLEAPSHGFLLNTSNNAKLGGLTIDTDLTPMKPLTGPTLSIRAETMPAPTAHDDIRFWVVAHDYDPREITFNQDGNMVGASLTVLVEKMTPHDGPSDNTFWTIFFYTFRLFTTPSKFLTALVARYNLQPPPSVSFGERERAIWMDSKVVPVRLRVYNLLKAWVETYWRGETDHVVLDVLSQFNSDVIAHTLPAMAPRLDQAIRKRQVEWLAGPPTGTGGTRAHRRTSSADRIARTPLSAFPPLHGGLPPTPIISKSLNSLLQKNPSSTNVNITEFDSIELARQLTIMESDLFAQVAPEDLLQTGKKIIPELKALSTLSNQITGWVADNILNEQDAKKRASLLKFYIKVADKCLTIGNFSTLFAVMAGLNSSIVTRLKRTWEALSAKYKVIMERLQQVIDHSKNHAAYRARLRDAESPCLPFLGLILTDITFTSDGNPDTRASSLSPDLQLINQDKYNKLGKIALDFLRYQEPFNFHELEVVQTFLRRALAERGSNSLDALYRKSLMLEPRQGSEKITSAFEKPGWLGSRT